ncbi:MAG: hypothetical protein WDN03_16410 [Rhizomicrobium sp.]
MLSVLLVGLLGVQFALPVDADLPGSTQLVPRRERPATVMPLASNFPEILRRPVFAPDRRPMVESMEGFTLIGVGLAGSTATALLQSGGSVSRVHIGDSVAGWRVASIEADQLLFQRNEERRMLKLDIKARRAVQSVATGAAPQ